MLSLAKQYDEYGIVPFHVKVDEQTPILNPVGNILDGAAVGAPHLRRQDFPPRSVRHAIPKAQTHIPRP